MRQLNGSTIIMGGLNGGEMKPCRQSSSSRCHDHQSLETVASSASNKHRTCASSSSSSSISCSSIRLDVLTSDGIGSRDIPRAISVPTTPIKLSVASNRTNSTPPRHFPTLTTNDKNSNHVATAVATANLSPHKRKIEAIGNGWNAKGLQNAKAGQWEKAVRCWENALDIRLQVLGEHHADVANTWNNLGIALGKMCDYHRAMACLNQALEIRTLIHYNNNNNGGAGWRNNNQDLEIAATLQNIGNIFQQMKDYNGALACFEQAKMTQLAWKEHVLVARTCTAVGRLHAEHLNLEEALASYKDALLFYAMAGYGKGDNDYNSVNNDICDTERQINHSVVL